MPNDRVDAALTLIEAIAGQDERRKTENDLRTKNLGQIDSGLSIGGFRGPFKSEPETFRRSLVRAVLLVKIAQNKVQLAGAAQQMTALMGKNTATLQRDLTGLFSFKPYRGSFEGRSHWTTTNFTDPTRHTANYKYLIHCLMQAPSKVAEYNMGNDSELENFNKLQQKYLPFAQVSRKNPVKPNLMVDFMAQYLDDLDILKANIISCSVISDTKQASYYPLGFILRVPPECIYITSPTDVGVANRTTDIIAELQRTKAGANHTIISPDQLLAGTNGTGGPTGYNEVVAVGTSPEGKQVEVVGIFVKTDAHGNLYVGRNLTTQVDDTAVYVTPASQRLISACARKFNIPIVPIADATSAVVRPPVAWPF